MRDTTHDSLPTVKDETATTPRAPWRPTLNPVWTHAIGVGNVAEATVNVSKDNVVFGVRAVSHDGHRSPAVFPFPDL